MDDSTTQSPVKQCSRKEKCVNPLGSWLPATIEYFGNSKARRDKLMPHCRACVSADNRRDYSKNAADKREYQHVYNAANKEKVKAAKRRYYVEHREENLARTKRYADNNREKLREYSRSYHSENAKRENARRRKYRLNNLERERQKGRLRRTDDREHARISAHRYKARKRNLPDTFTVTDWQRAVDYFNGCCAVCGRPLRDLFGSHTVAMDHWIPISDNRQDNPGTVPTNIIPLCHGEAGCNNRKSSRDPMEFLEAEFGKRRAREILNRVTLYFEWVTEQVGGK